MDLRQQIREHDATMTSFLAALSEPLESFVVTLYKIDDRWALESLVTIYVMFKEISREKDRRGGTRSTPRVTRGVMPHKL